MKAIAKIHQALEKEPLTINEVVAMTGHKKATVEGVIQYLARNGAVTHRSFRFGRNGSSRRIYSIVKEAA